ncbi:hypothetical protein ACFDR9_002822 [Janthinobacterium sp. CG_23.3]|uniref:DUF6506 family protein n=1 Tax=unclassified Janthinobacterium TaxID=2610881 RepID=UPI002DF9C69C|nr:hypothetical protein [Janthinobacterium sp. CG_S6]
MALTQFAMIIKGPGYDPAIHRASINSPLFSTTIVCVSSFEEAVVAAKSLTEQGIQLIELCGGFSKEQASALQVSLAITVPVGVVQYSFEEQHSLAKLFGKPASPH